MVLKTDIRSGCNIKRIYGRMGDEVKVIADHGHVCIVENEEGNRFPVLTEKLTTEKIIPKQAAPADAVAKPEPNINWVPVSKKKAPPLNQNLSLF